METLFQNLNTSTERLKNCLVAHYEYKSTIIFPIAKPTPSALGRQSPLKKKQLIYFRSCLNTELIVLPLHF